jgi:hypothetical protein
MGRMVGEDLSKRLDSPIRWIGEIILIEEVH